MRRNNVAAPCRKESDFGFTADQMILYEHSGFHTGETCLKDGVQINACFLDSHVKTLALKNTPNSPNAYLSGAVGDINGAGEPMYYNYNFTTDAALANGKKAALQHGSGWTSYNHDPPDLRGYFPIGRLVPTAKWAHECGPAFLYLAVCSILGSMRSQYDIIVVGGGLAGCAAAVASAREGKQTLLLERFGYLGGWATAALVNPFMTHRASDGKPLVSGLFDTLLDRLRARGNLKVNSFDSEAMIFELQEMVLESGADIRLHTLFESASFVDDGMELRLRSKSGVESVSCRRLIDCSGDGDAAVALGARFQTGDENGLPQAATLMFDVGGVDMERAIEYVRDHPDQMRFPLLRPDADPKAMASDIFSAAGYYDLVKKARDDGRYQAPGDLIFYITRPRKGEVVFNTTHIGSVNGTNADDLTRAEIEGRRQMMSVVSFIREYVPGFENAYLARSAAHVGIRETRRIVGKYTFSARDVIEAGKHR